MSCKSLPAGGPAARPCIFVVFVLTILLFSLGPSACPEARADNRPGDEALIHLAESDSPSVLPGLIQAGDQWFNRADYGPALEKYKEAYRLANEMKDVRVVLVSVNQQCGGRLPGPE